MCYVVKPVLMLYQNKPKSNSSNSVKQDPGKAAPPSSNSGRTVQAVKSEHNQGELQHSSECRNSNIYFIFHSQFYFFLSIFFSCLVSLIKKVERCCNVTKKNSKID